MGYKNSKADGDPAYLTENSYKTDNIRAVDAKFEAQKIAFAPLSFQAIKSMLDLGLMQLIEDAGDEGISPDELAEKSGVSLYGINVLCEMALGMNVIKLSKDSSVQKEKFTLGKIGWMLLEDECTRANFYFTADICYQGAFSMTESIRNSKPEGLKVFGSQWTTIYEALSSLPQKEKKSWFTFDHFYSDIAFPQALSIVFKNKPQTLVDIGGNTAKWAILCCKHDPDVKVTIVDLPGQTAVAEKNAAEQGFASRIGTYSGNVLREETTLPKNPDAFWMSQFLDCFSLHQITKISKKICEASSKSTKTYVLEPLWDKQKFAGNAYSLQATSLYFTCMANGNSKMYRSKELIDAIEAGGLKLSNEYDELGANSYTLLEFRKA